MIKQRIVVYIDNEVFRIISYYFFIIIYTSGYFRSCNCILNNKTERDLKLKMPLNVWKRKYFL